MLHCLLCRRNLNNSVFFFFFLLCSIKINRCKPHVTYFLKRSDGNLRWSENVLSWNYRFLFLFYVFVRNCTPESKLIFPIFCRKNNKLLLVWRKTQKGLLFCSINDFFFSILKFKIIFPLQCLSSFLSVFFSYVNRIYNVTEWQQIHGLKR